MKKFGLFATLLIGSLLLAGCNKTEDLEITNENCERDNSCSIEASNEGEPVENTEEAIDLMNDEKLLSLYPGLQELGWNVIIGDTFQTNYVNGTNNLYYDPYRGIALKLGAEFDGGLIREIDTDEGGIPHSQIIFLIKGGENEENRTGINGYREMFTIAAISKENLENFGASLDDLPFKYATIGENNQYYFVETNAYGTYSDLIIFDVE